MELRFLRLLRSKVQGERLGVSIFRVCPTIKETPTLVMLHQALQTQTYLQVELEEIV